MAARPHKHPRASALLMIVVQKWLIENTARDNIKEIDFSVLAFPPGCVIVFRNECVSGGRYNLLSPVLLDQQMSQGSGSAARTDIWPTYPEARIAVTFVLFKVNMSAALKKGCF